MSDSEGEDESEAGVRIPPGVHDITHDETEWSLDEDSNEGSPRTVGVLRRNARVLMNDGGDLIV